jgi:hypothetical protein
MGTRRVKLRGLGYWAKVFEDNRDKTGYENALEDIGGQTTIDIDLDDDMVGKVRESKSMKKGKPSEENPGMTRFKFTRKWQEKYGGGPPAVLNDEGNEWDYDEDGPIGNGSEVEVVLSVYDTSRKNIVGTRLEKVKVLNHIAYVPPTGEDDEEETPPSKQTKKKPVQQDMDDEIPF